MKEISKKCVAFVLVLMLLCATVVIPRKTAAAEEENHLENIALRATVSCDSCWSDGNWELSCINDGSKMANWPLPAGETLGWRSERSETRDVHHTIVFEFERVSSVYSVSIYPRGSGICFPTEYEIYTDEAEPSPVGFDYDYSNFETEGLKLVFNGPLTTDKLRVVVTKLPDEFDSGGRVAEISEIEIYGLPSPDAEYNVAKDANVTCASNWDDPEGYWRLAYIIDGSKLSGWPLPAGQTLGWRSAKNNETRDVNYEIVFEFDSLKTISHAVLYPRGGGNCFPDDYRLEASADGTNYTVIKSVTGDTEIRSEGRTLAFDPVDCKYVKLVITKLSAELDGSDNVAVLSEVEIFGKTSPNAVFNLAKDASVSCENNWDDPEGYWRLAFINDGSKMTDWPLPAGETLGWRSSATETRDVNYAITFKLDGLKLISEVDMYPKGNGGNCFPDDYSIQVSKNGTDYTTVKTVTDDTDVKQEGRKLTFDAVDCEYVRIVITKLSSQTDGGYVAELSEVEIFGKDVTMASIGVSVGVDMKVRVRLGAAASSDYSLRYTIGEDAQTIAPANGYFTVTGLEIADMATEINFELIYNEKVIDTVEGWSVKDYLMVDMAADEDYGELAADIARLGSELDKYYGGEGWEDSVLATEIGVKSDYEPNKAPVISNGTADKFTSAQLLIDDNFNLRFNFTTENAAYITISDGMIPAVLTDLSDGYIMTENLSVRQLLVQYTVTMYDSLNDEIASVTYSAQNYLYNKFDVASKQQGIVRALAAIASLAK